jgi:hypothetical protein
MRGYISISPSELQSFLLNGSILVRNLHAPTEDFVLDNPDLDEEELEFTLSMLAAQDALSESSEVTPLVAALEIPQSLIATSTEGIVTLTESAKWENLECVFLVEDSGEELTWFATQEVEQQLKIWLA